MPAPKGNLAQGKTPTLVIDSSAIRNHLFKGWAVLNRVAVVARTGKINLCIPWLVEQEVLSGIEKHVNELTGQEAFLKSARMIAVLSSEAATIRELCEKFENLRPKVCEEARNRFCHWLEMSQAERLPLKHEHTQKVFGAYFSGNSPFDKPKNREHLPDAFIYNAVLDLVSSGREVWFLAGDDLLRESLRNTQNVRIYRNFHPLFEDLQVPFDYDQQQALSHVLPNAQALCELAQESLHSELCGQILRYDSSEHSTAPRIREVLQVRNLSVDQQSVMHIDLNALLIAFEADVLVRAAERSIDNRAVMERLSEFAVSIRGHFLVGLEKSDNSSQKITTIEVDDIEVGAMEKNVAGDVVQSIAPQARVVYYYQDKFDNIVRHMRSGLVVVVGSTLRNRRIVAEHIIAAATKSHQVALLGFPPIHEKNLPAYDCKGETGPLWDKARDVDLHALALSSEDADWAIEAIRFLTETDCFIVATMKSANNRSAVVRYLAGLPNLENNLEHLLAVAWIQEVTPETITFAISQRGGWGNGTWKAVLERDEWLKRTPNS